MTLTYAVVLELLFKYGPQALVMAEKLAAAIRAGKGNEIVSEADWAELMTLGNQTAGDIYARLGITPPPSAPP